jgi:hypothetical protein
LTCCGSKVTELSTHLTTVAFLLPLVLLLLFIINIMIIIIAYKV